jgi:5-methylcytosine-specific restriction endonuclease McrA
MSALTRRKKRARTAAIARHGEQCAYCFKPLTRRTSTIDHIIPRSLGGTLRADNTVLACSDCNILKGDTVVRSIEEARAVINQKREMRDAVRARKFARTVELERRRWANLATRGLEQ